MVSAAARRARWASIRDRWRPVTVAALIALGGLGPTAPRPVTACERGGAVGGSTLVQLTEVNVQRQPLAPAEHPSVPPTPPSAGQGTESAQAASSTAAEGGSAGVLALRDSAVSKRARTDVKVKGHVELGYRAFLIARGRGVTVD